MGNLFFDKAVGFTAARDGYKDLERRYSVFPQVIGSKTPLKAMPMG
jgi:hypothetical protein